MHAIIITLKKKNKDQIIPYQILNNCFPKFKYEIK